VAQNPNPLHDPPEPPPNDPPTEPLHDPPGDPTYEPPQPRTDPTPNPASDPPRELPRGVDHPATPDKRESGAGQRRPFLSATLAAILKGRGNRANSHHLRRVGAERHDGGGG
jgi:hypothetical protein